MGSGNGDLVREATMRRVRRHVRAGIDAERDPWELADEVIRTYDLTPVEAGLAKTMIRSQHRRSRNCSPAADASDKHA